MAKTVLKWAIFAVALFVIGPFAGAIASSVQAPDGSTQASILISHSPARALLALALALLLTAIVGVFTSRLFTPRTGLFAAGLVAVWPAGALGDIGGLLRHTASAPVFRTLTFEALLVAAALLAVAWIVSRAGTLTTAAPPTAPSGLRAYEERTQALKRSLLAAAAGTIAGGIGAVIAARSTLPGQAIFAAAFAGALGTMAAVLVHKTVAAHWATAGLVLLIVAGPASGGFAPPEETLRALYASDLSPLARITPLHWFAGLLIGIPIGFSWGESLTTKPPSPTQA